MAKNDAIYHNVQKHQKVPKEITFLTKSSVLIWLYLSNCSWLIGGSAILLPPGLLALGPTVGPAAPLFLNGLKAEVGEAKGGGGSAVKELVMETICCNGLPGVLVKGIRGGGGRFEPDGVSDPAVGVVGGEADFPLSSSLKLSLSTKVSRLKSWGLSDSL